MTVTSRPVVSLAITESTIDPLVGKVEQAITRVASVEGRAGQMVNEHLRTGGKRFRARLALASAEAFGTDPHEAIHWAVAVELLHQATLVHDDIQDGDVKRRGKETVWVRHGQSQAINAGDLLLMLPYLAIADGPVASRGVLSALLAKYAVQTVVGQVDELDLLDRASWEWKDYVAAIRGKTGALMALPVHGAALIAGLGDEQAEAISEPFLSLGTLFQLQDDVLDLYGHKGRDRAGSDLYEGKVSGLVVAHLTRKPEDKPSLKFLLKTPREQTPDQAVLQAIQAFRNSGALKDVLVSIETLAAEIEGHPALAEIPALQRLAASAVQRAIQPIQAIMSEVSHDDG